MKLISQATLIKKLTVKQQYIHLSSNPICDQGSDERFIDECELREISQLLAWGYNVGGRPNGFWFAKGGRWLEFTTRITSNTFKPCCYLYDVNIYGKASEIMHIKTWDDFMSFDWKCPDYWLNYDYFDYAFFDRNNERWIYLSRRMPPPDKDVLSKDESIKSALIKNKIIYNDPFAAVQNPNYTELMVKFGIPEPRVKQMLFELEKLTANKTGGGRQKVDIGQVNTYYPKSSLSQAAAVYGIKRMIANQIYLGYEPKACAKFIKKYEDIFWIIEKIKHKRWDAFARNYSGIIFHTYQNEANEYLWFDSLDIASGCIWRPEGVVNMKLYAVKVGRDSWNQVLRKKHHQ